VRQKKTFNAIKLDLTGFKFNRKEANERWNIFWYKHYFILLLR
jgi:hypothetical protein